MGKIDHPLALRKAERILRAFLGFARLLVFSAVLLLAASSCRAKSESGLPLVHLEITGKKIDLEIANTVSTQMTGLMFRKEMAKDHGMLFVFPSSKPLNFWMKNTYIPLSIAYLDEKGVILNILEMPPLSEASYPSRGSAMYALEMNAGWFSRAGVKAGDVLNGLSGVPKAKD